MENVRKDQTVLHWWPMRNVFISASDTGRPSAYNLPFRKDGRLFVLNSSSMRGRTRCVSNMSSFVRSSTNRRGESRRFVRVVRMCVRACAYMITILYYYICGCSVCVRVSVRMCTYVHSNVYPYVCTGASAYVCADATACGRKCVRVCGHESGHVFSGSRMCLRCVCVHAWIYAYIYIY